MSRDILLVSDSGNGRMRVCRQAGEDLTCTAELDGEMGRALKRAAADADGVDDLHEWLRSSGYGFETDGSILAVDGSRPAACVVQTEAPTSIKSAVVQGIASTIGRNVRGSGSVVTCRTSASKSPAVALQPIAGFGKRGIQLVDPVQKRGACAVDGKGALRCSNANGGVQSLDRTDPKAMFRLVKLSGYTTSEGTRPKIVDVSVCADPAANPTSFEECIRERERNEIEPSACGAKRRCLTSDGSRP